MMKVHASLMTAGVVRWVEALEPSSRGVRVQYAAGQRTVISGLLFLLRRNLSPASGSLRSARGNKQLSGHAEFLLSTGESSCARRCSRFCRLLMMTDLSVRVTARSGRSTRFRAHRGRSVYAAGANPSRIVMPVPVCVSQSAARRSRKHGGVCFLAGVVKNNSHRVPVTAAQSANAMPHIHPIDSAPSLDGAMMHSERDRVALP